MKIKSLLMFSLAIFDIATIQSMDLSHRQADLEIELLQIQAEEISHFIDSFIEKLLLHCANNPTIALRLAIFKSFPVWTLKPLLKKGANINFIDENYMTILDIAKQTYRTNRKFIAKLQKIGAKTYAELVEQGYIK